MHSVPINELSTRFHPSLKIFLSADIVGSTALKQPFQPSVDQSVDTINAWALIIQAFYKDMQDNFRHEWKRLIGFVNEATGENTPEQREKYFGDEPQFWKTIGDEVLFWKDLTTDFQVWFVLFAWLEATTNTRSRLKRDGAKYGASLDLKCTAWLAGFPVRNKIIYSPRYVPPDQAMLPFDPTVDTTPEDEDRIIDFIGPSIDVGFRVSQWSTASRFFIGLDLAYLLAITMGSPDFNTGMSLIENGRGDGAPHIAFYRNTTRVYFGGTEYLKGVLGGLNYPKFWIDTHVIGSLDKLEEELGRSGQEDVNPVTVIRYCDRFYDDRSKYLMKPFINNDESATVRNIHPQYEAILRKLHDADRASGVF